MLLLFCNVQNEAARDTRDVAQPSPKRPRRVSRVASILLLGVFVHVRSKSGFHATSHRNPSGSEK